MLVFPFEFHALLGEIPRTPRPLKVFDSERRKKLLQLADLLLKTEATASTERSVNYLLALSDARASPEALPALPWVSARTHSDCHDLITLNLGKQPVLDKILPQMRFQARMNRRRE